jgi:hypothetical protein
VERRRFPGPPLAAGGGEMKAAAWFFLFPMMVFSLVLLTVSWLFASSIYKLSVWVDGRDNLLPFDGFLESLKGRRV